MRRSRVGGVCLSILMMAWSGLAQAEFCQDLDSILASATDGFASVRGELISDHQGPLSDTRVLWRCTLALTGANTCEVEWFQLAYSYNTFWHKQTAEANAASFEALRELLMGCGLLQKQTSKTGRSIWFVIASESNLDVTLAHNERRVRLSFTTPGYPNP